MKQITISFFLMGVAVLWCCARVGYLAEIEMHKAMLECLKDKKEKNDNDNIHSN